MKKDEAVAGQIVNPFPVPQVKSKLQMANQKIDEMIDRYFMANNKPICLDQKKNM